MTVSPLQWPTGISKADPTWEIAELFPSQGDWTEEAYLSLPGNRIIEFSHGRIELLPRRTTLLQLLVAFLYRSLHEFVSSRGLGMVLFSAMPVRLGDGKYREPDVLFMLAEHRDRIAEQCWHGADLVMEVVIDSDPKRDLQVKRAEYAGAGIPEYWIVEPRTQGITVLRLDGPEYLTHGQFSAGQKASSALLPGFEVDVREVFAAATF